MTKPDLEHMERVNQLRRRTDDHLNAQSPQLRDQQLQSFLAQARGPEGNALLIRQLTDAVLQMKKHSEVSHD